MEQARNMTHQSDNIDELKPEEFYQKLIRPNAFGGDNLIANKNQVAGHAGFFSLQSQTKICLKPFNTKCVRGRREHLFYQLIEYCKRSENQSNTNSSSASGETFRVDSQNKPHSNAQISKQLKYKYFPLLTYPSPATKCNCIIDETLFKLLSPHVANFYHVRHLSNSSNFVTDQSEQEQFSRSVYSNNLSCPCYGRNPKEKSSCSRDYEKIDFLSLEDLAAHCREPCIIDIKIGQITYDPMAIKEKVLEQSSKYKRLREFGFRILGMKLGGQIKDKTFGKTLETTDQVYKALDSFFMPLEKSTYKCAIIGQILAKLQSLLEWFEEKNLDQLRFFSSSLLIIYDSSIEKDSKSTDSIQDELAKSVRVSMIDFAHVFHVHDGSVGGQTNCRDENYIFGLKKLKQFFIRLYQRHLSPLPPHQNPHLPLE